MRNVGSQPITALHTCVRALSIGRESGVCGGEESGRRECTGCERARTWTGRTGAGARCTAADGLGLAMSEGMTVTPRCSSSLLLVLWCFGGIACLIHNGCSAGLVFLVLGPYLHYLPTYHPLHLSIYTATPIPPCRPPHPPPSRYQSVRVRALRLLPTTTTTTTTPPPPHPRSRLPRPRRRIPTTTTTTSRRLRTASRMVVRAVVVVMAPRLPRRLVALRAVP